MKKLMPVILLLAPVFAQQPEAPRMLEPLKLLGIPYDTFHKLYPDDCTDLKRVRVKDGKKKHDLVVNAQFVEMCRIRHHEKELAPGAEIAYEYLGFFSPPLEAPVQYRKAFIVSVAVKGSLLGMRQVYGTPEPPIEMPSSPYWFGSVTYGGAGAYTTLNNQGETHVSTDYWIKRYSSGWSVLIDATAKAWETWDMEVSDMEMGTGARPVVDQVVTFTMIPPK
jgi:hypothetical protein